MAEGRLLDLIRRMYCFGVSLMKMDVRQESHRHTEAIDSITRYTRLRTARLDRSLMPDDSLLAHTPVTIAYRCRAVQTDTRQQCLMLQSRTDLHQVIMLHAARPCTALEYSQFVLRYTACLNLQ